MGRPIPYETVAALHEQGKGVREIARELGRAPSSIYDALRRLKLATARDVATRTAQQIADTKLDVVATIQEVVASEMDDYHYLQGRANRTTDDKERAGLEQRKASKARSIRGYLSLVLDIHRALYNPEEVARAFKIIIEGIKTRVDTETAEKIFEDIDCGRTIKRIS